MFTTTWLCRVQFSRHLYCVLMPVSTVTIPPNTPSTAVGAATAAATGMEAEAARIADSVARAIRWLYRDIRLCASRSASTVWGISTFTFHGTGLPSDDLNLFTEVHRPVHNGIV